jgi:hypothetical protein
MHINIGRIIPEPTARSGRKPGTTVLIPHGYLYPEKGKY